MANLTKAKGLNNSWRLRFTLPERKPDEITFKASRLDAEKMKKVVEHRDEQLYTGEPDKQMEKWIRELPPYLRDKLQKHGVIDTSGKQTVGELIEAFKRVNKNVKDNTLKCRQGTYNNLIRYFGEDRPLHKITAQDADYFYEWMQEESRVIGKKTSLKPGTYQRRIKTVKAVFRLAVRYKWIDENPFEHIKGGSSTDTTRFFFVEPEIARKVYNACPNPYWRLVWAFARYGGLRMRSEFPLIRWQDIQWDNRKIVIREPKKTGRDEEFHTRIMPMFPELHAVLNEAWELSEPGDVYITDFYTRSQRTRAISWKGKKIPSKCNLVLRDGSWNPTTTLRKIIISAGIVPWEKLLQNCRSTRETELVHTFPIQDVTAWIGNSPKIAMKHYLQVTESSFQSAAEGVSALTPPPSQSEQLSETRQAPKAKAPPAESADETQHNENHYSESA